MLKSIILAASLASTLGASAAFASPPPVARPVVVDRHYVTPRPWYARWDSLGELRVNGRRPGASTLFVSRDAGPMTKLRLEVQRGDLGIKEVKVTLGNGETFVATMTGASATIDLPGGARFVRSLDIVAAPTFRRGGSLIAISGATAPMQRHAYNW